jgi:putative nucleotidyltransferase with HDIG domain
MTTTADNAPPAATPAMKSAHEGCRILIAEDEDGMRASLGYILNQWGHQVVMAVNGQEAVAAARAGLFDLILMDIQMPVMDGLRALTLIRREPVHQQTPAILLTQSASIDVVKQAVTLGIKDLIVKQHYTPDRLFQKIEAAIGDHRRKAAAKPVAPGPAAGKAKLEASTAAAPAAAAGEVIDQQAWKERVAAAGRQDKEQTRKILDEVQWPAIIPAIAGEISKEHAASSDLSDATLRLIEQDIALLLRVLEGANKSRDDQKASAEDVATARQWIGKEGVQQIIQERQSLAEMSDDSAKPWIQRWWRHSMATAAVAAELATAIEVPPASARIAGLFHDLGRLALLCCPAKAKLLTCYEMARNMIIPTTMAEQLLLGMNHKQVGVELLRRMRLSERLIESAQWHDLDDAQIAKLAEADGQFAALLCAADQIAKSSGFGSLANDELSPLPATMAQAATELELQIEQALSETRKLTAFRLGAAEAALADPPISLAGVTVTFVSPVKCPWNPYRRTLAGAGATMTDVADVKTLMDKPPLNDLVVIDHMNASLSVSMPILRRVRQAPALASSPMILLARRSDDPEMLVSQSNLKITVYSSPIRSSSLLQLVKRTVGS